MLRAMMRTLSLTVLVGALALTLTTLSCIDTAEETGYYSAPCSGSFHDILLCARETGGATPPEVDLVGRTEEERFTCSDACQRMVTCGYVLAEDVDPCVFSCLRDSMFDQEVLDCIRDNECNVNQCFAGL